MLNLRRILIIMVLAGSTWLNAYAQPGAFNLSAPADGAIDRVNPLTLSWTSSAGAVSYTVEYHTGGGFPGNRQEGIVSTSINSIVFAYSSTVTWRVIAFDGLGDSTYSTGTFSFSTLNPPTAPVLTAPADGVVGQELSPVFSWSNGINGFVTHDLQIADDAGFTINLMTFAGVTSSSVLWYTLNHNQVYYWRVRANNAAGSTLSSTFRSFTTKLETPAGLTVSPVSAATGNTGEAIYLMPKFNWNNVPWASQYIFSIFQGLTNLYTGTTASTNINSPITLLPNTNYTFWVYSYNTTSTNYSDSTSLTFTSSFEPPVLLYPVSGSTGHPLRPRFGWNPVSGAVYYRIQIDNNNDFSSPFIDDTTSFGTYYDLFTDLANNTTYYWRVSAYRAGDDHGCWSGAWNFVTTTSGRSGIAYPVPNYPINGTVIYIANPYLGWYMSTSQNGINLFEVEFKASDDDFRSGDVFTATSTTVGAQISGLMADTKYYWRIRAFNGSLNLYSSWSDTAYFITDKNIPGLPVQPTAVYPANNAVVYSMNPQLHWYITSYVPGVEWRIQVRGVSPAVSGYNEIFTSTSYQYYYNWPTTLLAGENYRWRVRSRRAGYDASDWSEWAAFSIYQYVNGTPVKPTPVWPVNHADVFVNPPLLSWYINNYTTGVSYEVELKLSTVPFDGSGTLLTGSYQQFYQLTTQLTPGVLYHWRVRSRTATLISQWSDEAAFHVNEDYALGNSLQQPQLFYPVGLPVYTTQPILSWYVNSLLDITGYKIKIATDPVFNNQIAGSPFTSTNLSYKVVSGLVPGTTYFWSVQSSNGIAFSTPSALGQFTIVPGYSAPVVPQIGGPDGICIQSASASLNWYLPVQGDSLEKFELEYSNSKDFRNSSVISNITKSEYLISGLKPGAEYYWRVRTVDANNTKSEYSLNGSFITSDLTGVSETIIPDKFVVEQNYPNPFNPVTNIKVNLPKNSILSVRIYNVIGQEVRELINNEMNPGEYTLQWNGENNSGQTMPSGTYICRVVAGDNIQTIKMVLLK